MEIIELTARIRDNCIDYDVTLMATTDGRFEMSDYHEVESDRMEIPTATYRRVMKKFNPYWSDDG